MNDINAIIDAKVEAAVVESFSKWAIGLNKLDSAMYARGAEQAKRISELDKAVDARLSELAKNVKTMETVWGDLARRFINIAEQHDDILQIKARARALEDRVSAIYALANNAVDRIKVLEGAHLTELPIDAIEAIADTVIASKALRRKVQEQVDLALSDLDPVALLKGVSINITVDEVVDPD